MSYLTYGGYSHASGDAQVVIGSAARFSPRGIIETVQITWQIRGVLHAANSAALIDAMATLEAAYSINGQDLRLYSDGGLILHELPSGSAMGGTRVIAQPAYPVGTGAETGTFRTYEITVQADYPNTGQNLLDFSEDLDIEGDGGPSYVFLETLESYPQVQVGRQFTVSRARQTGRAVGLFAYPPAAPPVFPLAELTNRRRIRRKSPRLVANTYRDFIVEWTYEFESNTPLSGYPNVV